jgi:uncharacterized cupredoxin-like copper-binding protein
MKPVRGVVLTGALAIVLLAAALTGMSAFGASSHASATPTITVTAGKPSEFRFTLSQLTNIPSGQVQFKVTNRGKVAHSFEICKSPFGGSKNTCAGAVTRVLKPGQTQTLKATLTKGRHEFLCTVAGHAATGMKGVITVVSAVKPLATVLVTAGKPSEFAFKLSKSSGLPVGLVAFKVTNAGSVPHSFEVCNKPGTANSCTGVKTRVLGKGQSQTIMVNLTSGIHEYLCTVTGHAAAGMKGQLSTAGVTPPKTTTTSTTTKTTSTSKPFVCNSPTTSTVNVNEFEYSYTFSPSTIHCGTITFIVHNIGQLPHNIDFLGTNYSTDYADPGETNSITAQLSAGNQAYQCDYPEHSSLGMIGSFTVVD